MRNLNDARNWMNIRVEESTAQWNGRRILFHQCQAVDVQPTHCSYGRYDNGTPVKCGSNAMYLVTRTSMLTGNTYTDHMCERHAQGWKGVNDHATTDPAA